MTNVIVRYFECRECGRFWESEDAVSECYGCGNPGHQVGSFDTMEARRTLVEDIAPKVAETWKGRKMPPHVRSFMDYVKKKVQ
jgi:peroxiredoxin